MKKFMQLALVLAMSFFCMSGVNAATKEEVISYAEQHAPAVYAEQIKRYLNTYDATPEELDVVLENGEAIVEIMDTYNVDDPRDLPNAELKAKVESYATTAAEAVDATLNYDPTTGEVTVLDPNNEVFVKLGLPDENGNISVTVPTRLKPTGNDYQVYVAFSGLAIVAAATALYRKLKTNA